MVGGCIEASTWLLCLWAARASPAHPEDTIPMVVFNITQIPSIFLGYLLMPLTRLIGLSQEASAVLSSAIMSVVQGFLFAVLAYFFAYKPQKTLKG
jgi:hypothetical protein